VHRYRVSAPSIEPISAVGSGDVLLAAFLAAQLKGESAEDALRAAVATGTASTLEVGAGRFDQREVGRLAGAVQVIDLEPVGSSR
jgi:fructose-1-phosphate kinase PfkB-like protein